MAVPVLRPMPGYDPDWQSRYAAAQRRAEELRALPGGLDPARRAELAACWTEMELARDSRFRTTRDYRDHYMVECRELLAREEIYMELPSLPDDCSREEVDQMREMVFRAVEVTNSECF